MASEWYGSRSGVNPALTARHGDGSDADGKQGNSCRTVEAPDVDPDQYCECRLQVGMSGYDINGGIPDRPIQGPTSRSQGPRVQYVWAKVPEQPRR